MSNRLKKEIGLVTATSIVIGIVIGSGVFVKPGVVLAQAGSPMKALLAWFVGGVMTIAAGLTIAEIAARIPRTGGVFAYVETLYGKRIGFLCGWVLTFIYSPGLKGALSLYFSTLIQPTLGFKESQIPLFAIATLVFLASMNMLSTRWSGYLTTLTTFLKLIPIVLIALFGILNGGVSISFSPVVSIEKVSFSAAVLSTLWAYDGWMLVGNMAGEMKNPVRHLPKAIIGGLLLVIFAYMGVNYSLFSLLTTDQILNLGPKAANFASEILFGAWGGSFVSLGILISIFGCLNSDILSGPRVPYAMMSSGGFRFGSFIAFVHPKFGTPIYAILLQVIVAIFMILLADANLITDFAIFSVYIFYVFVFAGIFRIRKRQKNNQSKIYQSPLYPLMPFLAICSALYILGTTIYDRPFLAIISIGLTLAGYPIYLVLKKDN